MRPALAALLLAGAVFAPASAARQGPGAEAARPGRPQAVVAVGAVDKEGRAVEGLRPEDLRVTVEGQEQKVLSLSRRTEEPLHVVVMLDASASQESILPQVRPAAAEFVSALLRPGRDDAAVVSFTNEAKVVQGLTSDAAAVGRAIASVRFVAPPGYLGAGVVVYGRPPRPDPAMRAAMTALWDSLVAVCDEVFKHAKEGRRAVVIVTDGVDTGSGIKSESAVERLTREGVAVYGVGLGDSQSFDGVDRSAVRKLSERTGGRAVFPRPKKPEELPAAFERIRGELLTHYALTFAPPAPRRDGKPLRLRVEVVNPELRRRGVQLAHPQSLFAGPGGA